MQLDELLARPGLPPSTRLCVLAVACIWRGDWQGFGAAAAAALARGVGRADLEEALLQAVLFCGFPRVVTAFERLGQAWPAARPPRGGGLPRTEQLAAGRTLFAAIYGRNDAAVRAMLRDHHEELHDFVLEAAYGRILSRPGLPAAVRELLAAGTLAAMDQERQFVAHARGALRLGATADELREVLRTVFGDGASVERWLHRVRR